MDVPPHVRTKLTMKNFSKIAALLAAIFLSQSAVSQSAVSQSAVSQSAISQTAHSQTSSTQSDTTWRVRGVSSLFKLTATSPGKIEAFPPTPIHLRAARDEWVCFQVVVSANDKTLKHVQIDATSFATHLGQFITRDNIEIYRENFVPVKTPSGNRVLVRKLWSDALLPIGSQNNIDIAPQKSEAFWVAVKVPIDTAPADYFCAVEVRAEGETMRELPIVLSVSKAKMPAPTLRANVAVYYDSLRTWYTKNIGVQTDDDWNAQKKRYYQFLLDYRLNAYDLPVSWNSDEADIFLRDKRVLGVRTPPLNSSDFDIALKRLQKNDAISKAYYYYLDEPTPEKYDEVLATTRKMHAKNADISHVVTVAPNKALRNAVDIWCPNLGDFFGVGHLDNRVLEEQRQQGFAIWWYTMVEPKYPYPTWLLDDDASAINIFGWQMARWKIGGFVYSMAHGWGEKPLQNLESFAATNGDGTLLYPGELVGAVGPMPSIRLMLLRDAIEDYELLRALPEKQRNALFEYSMVGDDLTFPIARRRAWEKRYDELRAKLLALSSGEKVSFSPMPITRVAQTKLKIGKNGSVPFVRLAPKIDGKLNDAAWNNASLWRGNFARVDNDNVTIPNTKLWLCHNARFLYVAIRAQHLQRAAKIVVDIAPANADSRWRFVALSDGAQRIEKHTREGHFQFESKDIVITRVTNNARNNEYSIVEMKIPLSLINNATRFRLNVSRRVYFPPSEMFYTARAFLDADDVTKMPFVQLAPRVTQ